MADIAIIEPVQSGSAPLAYNLADRQPLQVLAVHADFDGTGAGGSFKPAVSYYAPDGQKLGTWTADTVTAGSSSSVTWFPFAPQSSSGGTTDPLAVHFNTSPQANTFLEVEATTNFSPINIKATGGGDLNITSTGSAANSNVNITADAQVFQGAPALVSRIGNGGDLFVQNHTGGTIVDIWDAGNIELHLGNGKTLFVYDHTNAPVFEVRDDGSIHGKAAIGAITWDL